MKKIHSGLPILLLFCLFLFPGCGSDDETIIVYEETETLEIGALLPLTGDAANNGEPMLSALRIAEERLNQALENENSDKRVQLVYSDTRSSGTNADILMESFISQGIRFIIGPVTSEELIESENTINASDSLLISPSSTLSYLSVEDDNIYRFVPDDIHMANAIAEVLWHEGIRHLAILYRDDATWSTALSDSVAERFIAMGGSIIGSEAYINLPRQSDFSDKLEILSGMISTTLESADPAAIGFQLICLSEGDEIMETAATDSVLGQVRWFGSDGFVQTDIDFFSEAAAQFAVQTQYMAPIFGIELSPTGEDLKTEIETEIGATINIYPILTYDAFMAAADALLSVDADSSLEDLRSTFLSGLESYEGAAGTAVLNAAGDRENGDYYFWRYVLADDEYQWTHAMTFTGSGVETN